MNRWLIIVLLIVGCDTFEVYDPICIKENCHTVEGNLTTCSFQCYRWKWRWQNETESSCETARDGTLNQDFDNCEEFCKNNRCAEVEDSTDSN